MDGLRGPCLMVFCCFILGSINGEGNKDSSCELMVHRGTTWTVSPQQPLTVDCPVKHCRESLKVVWCKLSSQDQCQPIDGTESVTVTQSYHGDELTSHLHFKNISILDDGLYRCYLKGHEIREISHIINISVTYSNQGVKLSVQTPFAFHSPNSKLQTPPDDSSWWPYFFICFGITLLAIVLTFVTHLIYHGWKEKLNSNLMYGKETSRSVIPDLPRRTEPTAPVLPTHFTVLNDIYTPRTCSPPPLSTPLSGQPADATANKGPESDYASYAVIDHRQPRLPARKHPIETKGPEYAAVNFS